MTTVVCLFFAQNLKTSTIITLNYQTQGPKHSFLQPSRKKYYLLVCLGILKWKKKYGNCTLSKMWNQLGEDVFWAWLSPKTKQRWCHWDTLCWIPHSFTLPTSESFVIQVSTEEYKGLWSQAGVKHYDILMAVRSRLQNPLGFCVHSPISLLHGHDSLPFPSSVFSNFRHAFTNS